MAAVWKKLVSFHVKSITCVLLFGLVFKISLSFSCVLQLKYNIGCQVFGRYRTPMGSFRERRLHIAAAAKAQLRGVGVAKRRRSNADGGLLSDVPSLVESVHLGQDAAAATFPSGILQVSFESLMKFRCHILVISKM